MLAGDPQQIFATYPDLETRCLVDGVEQPHFPQGVLVLVEGQPVETHGEAAAAAQHLADRRQSGADDEVRARVDDDGGAARGDQVHLVGPQPDAMRERDPLVDEADLVQIAHDALREGAIGPIALVARFEQVHVHAASAPLRRRADPAQHLVAAPLHAGRSVLDGDAGALDIGGDRLDHGHLLGGRHRRAQQASRDAGAGRGRERGQQRLVRVVDQRIEVAAMHGERDVDADIARGLRDCRASVGKSVRP